MQKVSSNTVGGHTVNTMQAQAQNVSLSPRLNNSSGSSHKTSPNNKDDPAGRQTATTDSSD